MPHFLKIITPVVIGSLILTGYKSVKTTVPRQEEPSVTTFPATLTEVAAMEQKLYSQDVSYSFMVKVGENLYPNKLHFDLTKTKRYLRTITREGMEHTVECFATADDSVRVILHEWSVPKNVTTQLSNTGSGDPASQTKVVNVFNNKFTSLDSSLTRLIGKPTVRDIKTGFQKEIGRDDVKWTGNQLNAYLLMFKRDNDVYRQIRLIVYPK
ncbi:MAG: hypothetical protein J7621_05625 [Niastella sp.]|nr:hypothetical protein [Niastella sp.]